MYLEQNTSLDSVPTATGRSNKVSCPSPVLRGPYHTEVSSADKRLLAFLFPLLEWELGPIPSAVSLLQGWHQERVLEEGQKR